MARARGAVGPDTQDLLIKASSWSAFDVCLGPRTKNSGERPLLDTNGESGATRQTGKGRSGKGKIPAGFGELDEETARPGIANLRSFGGRLRIDTDLVKPAQAARHERTWPARTRPSAFSRDCGETGRSGVHWCIARFGDLRRRTAWPEARSRQIETEAPVRHLSRRRRSVDG